MAGTIRVGIGGWTFEPWRGTFYPKGLSHAKELEYASRAVTTIEVNGTFYRTGKPADFRKWAGESPDGFVFSLKAPRYAVNRRVLAEAGPSIDIFLGSGISELGPKLGPILWQFAPTKKFDAEDFSGFLSLLPPDVNGLPLRHAIEVRHESFRSPEFVEMARKAGAAIVIADSDDYPLIADLTGDFVYARLQRTEEEVETGYPAKALALWQRRAKAWAAGKTPDDLELLAKPGKAVKSRDVFVFMIAGAKVRAPAAAMAMIEGL